MAEQTKAIKMTLAELIYIAEQLGATELFGIPDPYYGLNMSERRVLKNRTECLLEEKGILVRGFEKSELKRADSITLIKTCIFCDKFAGFDYLVGGEQKSILYYLKEDSAVRIENIGNVVDLKRILPKEIIAEIKAVLLSENNDGVFSFSVTYFTINAVEHITVEKDEEKYVKISIDKDNGNVVRTEIETEELIRELQHIGNFIDMEV